jgi:hypothetical protein
MENMSTDHGRTRRPAAAKNVIQDLSPRRGPAPGRLRPGLWRPAPGKAHPEGFQDRRPIGSTSAACLGRKVQVGRRTYGTEFTSRQMPHDRLRPERPSPSSATRPPDEDGLLAWAGPLAPAAARGLAQASSPWYSENAPSCGGARPPAHPGASKIHCPVVWNATCARVASPSHWKRPSSGSSPSAPTPLRAGPRHLDRARDLTATAACTSQGFAHSIEAQGRRELAGGLYVCPGGPFSGVHVPLRADASKAALTTLVLGPDRAGVQPFTTASRQRAHT